MQIITETPEKIIIRTDVSESLANSIRRSIDEVPTLAVDEVEFHSNDSALYDEMVAHRIGLVPLKTDRKMNSKTEITLKLKKSGPGTVYSGDLKGSADVVFDNIPITLLEKGQELELIATAKLGRGTDHAKYIPGLCYYRYLYLIKSKNSKVEQIINDSKGLVKEKQGSGWIMDLNELEEEEIERLDKEAISNSGEILLFVESYGQMKAKDLLKDAVSSLENNLDKIEKSLK